MTSTGEMQRPGPQPEGIATARVVTIALAALVVFALAVLAVWFVLRHRVGRLRTAGGEIPAALGRPEIGLVNQRPFPVEDRASRKWESSAERLESYGWVDRERNLIHVPIRTAMEDWLESRRARPAVEEPGDAIESQEDSR